MKGPPVPVAFDDPAPSSFNSMGSMGSQGKSQGGGGIPFMTFKPGGSSFDDLSQAPNSINSQYSLQGNLGSMGSMTYHGSASFDDEPPLLEELGIDPALVLKKSLEVLSPKHVDPKLLADGDISGLLIYGTALGLCHLLAGKVQFGDILGFSVMMLCGVYWIVNCMLAEEDGAIELNRISSLSGYCLLPIVAYAALCIVMPARCVVGCILCILAVLWSTHAATNALCSVLPALRENKLLIGVPCFLMYSMYALLTIY